LLKQQWDFRQPDPRIALLDMYDCSPLYTTPRA